MRIKRRNRTTRSTNGVLVRQLDSIMADRERAQSTVAKLMVENEDLRNQLLEATTLHLRNMGLKLHLEISATSGTLGLQLSFSEAVHQFHSPRQFANMVADRVRFEIMKRWPSL